MGITLTPAEELAYLAVWRHIGYYLGISPTRLERYYSNVSSASKLFASNTMHLFNTDWSKEDYRTTSTYRLLSAVANRPPQYLPVDHALAMSRILLGNGLANRLAIPKSPLWRVVRIRSFFYLEKYLDFFGKHYLARWEVDRVEMTRMLLLMVVCWQLGVRRTKFTIKAFMADGMGKIMEESKEDRPATGVATEEGAAANSGSQSSTPGTQSTDSKMTTTTTTTKEEGTADDPAESRAKDADIDDNDELDPEVVMGPEAGKAIIKQWKWLLGEMAVVSIGFAGVAGLGLWGSVWAGRMLWRSW
jgi:hypothetical protein